MIRMEGRGDGLPRQKGMGPRGAGALRGAGAGIRGVVCSRVRAWRRGATVASALKGRDRRLPDPAEILVDAGEIRLAPAEGVRPGARGVRGGPGLVHFDPTAPPGPAGLVVPEVDVRTPAHVRDVGPTADLHATGSCYSYLTITEGWADTRVPGLFDAPRVRLAPPGKLYSSTPACRGTWPVPPSASSAAPVSATARSSRTTSPALSRPRTGARAARR